ncbi:MAG: hypothetical protein ACK2UB_04095, partial [Anaerolineales bacterium]
EEICSSCGGGLAPDPTGALRCGDCGAAASPPLTVCPRCRNVHSEGVAVCRRCSADVSVQCPGCGRINWAGVDRCAACGRELDVLGHAFRSAERSAHIRRAELLRRIPALKEQEERGSRQRMEPFREADQRRIHRAAERAEKAKQRERRIVQGAGIAVVILFLLLVLAAVWLSR